MIPGRPGVGEAAMTEPSGCPNCGQAQTKRYRPFCSKRCADLGLGRWFSGTYRFAAAEPPGEADLAGIDWGNVSALPQNPGEDGEAGS